MSIIEYIQNIILKYVSYWTKNKNNLGSNNKLMLK